MLVGPAKVFFMDEISTGLDSSTTYQIVKFMKQIVHIIDVTMIISLLQPAPETFELFDDIILLSEGQIVYQGPREDILSFFESAGFKCPERKGVADFLQEVTSKKDQEQYWSKKDEPYCYVSVPEFVHIFSQFQVGERLYADLAVPYDKTKVHPAALVTKKYGISNTELLKANLARELLLMKRNAFLYIFKTTQITIMSVITFTVFFRTEMKVGKIEDGGKYFGALFFSLITVMFNGAAELGLTTMRLPVFFKQRDSLFYPAWAFAPIWIMKIPISIMESLIWICLTYYTIGFAPSASRFFKQLLAYISLHQMALSLFRFISALGRTQVVVNAFGTFSLLLVFVLGGFIVAKDDIHPWMIWGYYISPMMYGQNAIAINEFLDDRWSTPNPDTRINEPTVGKVLLKSRGMFTTEYMFWVCVVALFGFSLLFNLFFVLALTYLNPPGDSKTVVSTEGEQNQKHLQTGTEMEVRNSNKKGMVLPFQPLSLAFDHVNYYVDMPAEMKAQGTEEDRLQLLQDISGAFRPGILTALVGVSGAGKTTLMDVLAGRKTNGYIDGSVSISGYPKNQETFARVSGYCEQNDIHSPHVTVYESLVYSAWLRLAPDITKQTCQMFVEEVMDLVELNPLRNARVGLPGINGLSTEQRKRLTIAVELVANPSIIFMDEPTSGLDARAAAVVMRTVRNTVDTGRTVVCTIHQPSIDIFESFDELLLMKRGGKVTYAGPLGHHSHHLIEYFESIPGVNKIKEGQNPATWMLDISSSSVEAQLNVDFAEIYANSDLYRRNQELIKELSTPVQGSHDLHFPTKYSQSFWTQCLAFLWKQHWSYWRHPQYNAVRFFMTIVIGLLFGMIFWDKGQKMDQQQGVLNLMGAMYASVMFLGGTSTSAVQTVVSVERTVFYREKAAGMYSAIPYAFAQVAIEVFYTGIQTFIYSLLIYSMIGFEWSADKFFWFYFYMFMCFVYFVLYGMMLVALTPNYQIAAITMSFFLNFWNLFSGLMIPRTQLPIWWRWYYWGSPVAWTVYGLITSQLGKNERLIVIPGQDSVKVVYQKRQCVSFPLSLVGKKWHFLCITHSVGRAFSGGSHLKCYLDGVLVSSEKCSYAKVTEPLTSCMIGAPVLHSFEGDAASSTSIESYPFFGQIGPVYLFNDAITSEQVQGIFFLGLSYMYSFLDNEFAISGDNLLPSGVLDAKDGLASKIVFGLNAQASNRRALFNVSPLLDHALDKSPFEATVKSGTQLCSRRLLQQIIYCAGGVSVFFPLFTRIDLYEDDSQQLGHNLLTPITKERLTAEIIELVASVLDENLPNQQQMLNLSGFSVLGFLLQSVPSHQLNMETLSALKHMLNVISNCGLAEVLVKDAISHVFLNPFIWVYAGYKVQRELYMFLIQQFDNDPRLLRSLCRFPRILDIIQQFYWDNMTSHSNAGGKPLLPITNKDFGERPNKEEIQKIRLLLLSIGEMSLREHIAVSDIESLVSFLETSQDMACIEDVLHMIIRALSQKSLLASFLDQVNLVGGCHLFINLLQRNYEPVRLLGLQLLGRLLVAVPSEKKGSNFFTLAIGRSKSHLEGPKRVESRLQPIFSAMSDRLFRFPQTDVLCATFFDVLLGGASPKQVIQRHNQPERQRVKGSNAQFFLPQILVLIFNFLSGCEDVNARIKIMGDLLELLDSNVSNIEAFMENGWNGWLDASSKLDVLKTYKMPSQVHNERDVVEQDYARNLFSVVLCHYVQSVKGGWQQLEETVNFLLIQYQHGGKSYQYLLRDIYEDLITRLVDLSSKENILSLQPCRDNTCYLMKLIDEMLISELDNKLPFPACGYDFSPERIELENDKDLVSSLYEALQGENHDHISRDPKVDMQPSHQEVEKTDEAWWNLYDKLWVVTSEIHGKGPSRFLQKTSSSIGPSFGQRARGLVESLNIPAAEMAAVVVSGGISNALGGKPNKVIDKAILLRSEKCSRIAFRLMIVYLCKSSLERASRCVQQFIPILPCLLTSDDEQSKSRLQLFIWALLAVRSQFGMLDDGARFHVIAHLIREAVDCGKLMLATSIIGRDDASDTGNITIQNLIQKDRVLAAVSDEVRYLRHATIERKKQLDEFPVRMDENMSFDLNQWKTFEDEIRSSLNTILTTDDSRRASFQLAHDEEQQVTAENWIHMLRTLIDERGPWSANPFPNDIVTHWKLDKTEDTWRRRQKLRKNYHFDRKLCHPSSTLPTTGAISSATETKSGFAAHIPQQMKQFLLKGIRRITDESFLDSVEFDAESSELKASDSEDLSERQFSEGSKVDIDMKDLHERKDHSSTSTSTSTSVESEDSEVLMSLPCVLVTPKRKLAGRLAVMKKVLHFFGEFLVEGTGGSSVFRNIQASGSFESNKTDNLGMQKQKFIKWPADLVSTSDGEAPDDINAVLGNLLQKQSENIKRHRRWELSKIKAVHWTRYLLRYTAIEVYFNDSAAPVFLNFASNKEAKDVGSLIVATRNELVFPKGYRDKAGVISFVDRRVSMELAETAKESWRRRDITNFEYLMILNTLAGRSYNDLTQYPVFPWVLADYSSEVLDFNKSSTFRDLSKPVGALDQKRFEVFEDRYRNFSDPDIPSFYYGSHYSSMGIVLYYLLRLEPFTGLHRALQGGKFDHADRLFQSMESTYRNCLSNTSDVKELVPEFFYMPEFLVNSNSYHLGVKQDGEPLNDVGLPPWAKGSPEEFISINREALESEYVSSNLHHWIDLVFGYKQRGKPAVEAANIFYYLTYEGAVDLETMEDELQRSAIEDQIANFGQTPIQLFRKKHPRRGPPIPIAHPLRFAPSSINLTSIVPSASTLPSAVLYVGISDSNVVLVNQGLTMSIKMWLTTQMLSGGNFTFSSSQDPYFAIGADVLSPRRIGSPLAENIELGAQCFTTMQTPSGNFLVSCGNWENSFQLISLNDGRLVQSVRQHKDVVSCVYVTSDGSTLATGSYDTTVMIWEVLRTKTPEKRARYLPTEFHRKDYVIADTPYHILCGHDDIITCLYVSVELDLVISGSKDGTCVFHTLQKGRYLRSLQHPSGCQLSKLVASRHGKIVLYAEDDLCLHLYSINGKHLNSCESSGRLNCIELSSCGEFLVCAGDQGQIVVRSMKSLEIIGRYSGVGKIITSLTVTQEECVLAGTKDGSLLVYSIENPQLRRISGSRSMKSKATGT